MRKKVVLLSGGLDSTLAFVMSRTMYDRKSIGLFVDMGQPYSSKEERVVDYLQNKYGGIVKLKVPIITSENNNVPTIEDQIIPGRNFTLAALAANYGEEIWLSALDGEMHNYMPDKSRHFFDLTQLALSQAYGRQIVFRTPFATMTKVEAVKFALEIKVPESLIRRTSTCYHEEYDRCGECSACFKRWVALSLNYIEEDYRVDPRTSAFAAEYEGKLISAIERDDFTHYSKKRIKEVLKAIGKLEHLNKVRGLL